jgi:uncharacterized membrane protein
MMGFGWMGGGMWFMWIALAIGFYFLFYGTPLFRRESYSRAIRIAEERYAQGEISAEELEEIRDHLEY